MINNKTVTIEYFKNLIAISAADGVLDENEREFLREKAVEFGLPAEEIEQHMDNFEELSFQISDNSLNKEEQLTDIVYMAMIDGELHAKEYELCVNIAQKLGLTQKHVDKIIKMIKSL